MSNWVNIYIYVLTKGYVKDVSVWLTETPAPSNFVLVCYINALTYLHTNDWNRTSPWHQLIPTKLCMQIEGVEQFLASLTFLIQPLVSELGPTEDFGGAAVNVAGTQTVAKKSVIK